MSEQEQSFIEIFKTLSNDAKELLIAMTHASPEAGMKKGVILEITGMQEQTLAKAMDELTERNLLQTGTTQEGIFTVGQGDRYRLSAGINDKFKKQILKIETDADLKRVLKPRE